jgi:hypothetical protein
MVFRPLLYIIDFSADGGQEVREALMEKQGNKIVLETGAGARARVIGRVPGKRLKE